MSSLNANELDGKRLFATTLVQWLPCATFSPGQANGSQAIQWIMIMMDPFKPFCPKDLDKFMNCVLTQAVMQATTINCKWINMVRYGENDCYTRLVPFLKRPSHIQAATHAGRLPPPQSRRPF